MPSMGTWNLSMYCIEYKFPAGWGPSDKKMINIYINIIDFVAGNVFTRVASNFSVHTAVIYDQHCCCHAHVASN